MHRFRLQKQALPSEKRPLVSHTDAAQQEVRVLCPHEMGSGVSLVKPEITLVRFLWMVGAAYFKLFIKFKSFTHSLIHSKLFAAFSVAGTAPGWAALSVPACLQGSPPGRGWADRKQAACSS